MTLRSLCAIIFALIVASELYIFIANDPGATVETTTQKTIDDGGTTTGGGFSRFADDKVITTEKTGLDVTETELWRNKFLIIISVTVVTGGIVTFSLPNKVVIKQA